MQNCKMFMIDLRTFVVKFLSQFTHIFRQYLFCQKAVFANLFAFWMYEPDGVLLVSFERFYKVVSFVWSCLRSYGPLWMISIVDTLGRTAKIILVLLARAFMGLQVFPWWITSAVCTSRSNDDFKLPFLSKYNWHAQQNWLEWERLIDRPLLAHSAMMR